MRKREVRCQRSEVRGLRPVVLALLLFVSGRAVASAPDYSTYIGGSGDEIVSAISGDNAGNVYVAGSTNSTDLTAASNANSGGYDPFITKLDPTGAVIYSVYLGGSGDDFGKDIRVDNE